MIRFNYTVYYKLEDTLPVSLHGINLLFDQELSNRFFDVLCRNDSLQIEINGSTYYFKQKNRKEPKNYKEILFYSRRILRNDHAAIKYLKLLEIKDSAIIASAVIRYKHHIFKKKEMIEIQRKNLQGIFIGAGKNNRLFFTIIWLSAGIYTITFP
jgi:hypothetical protein